MSESRFKSGMLVQVISTDDFYPIQMPVGSIWEVTDRYGTGFGEVHAFQDLINGDCQ